jgi:hypothetical protein
MRVYDLLIQESREGLTALFQTKWNALDAEVAAVESKKASPLR